jgi:type VI secretion system secreted protein Hcp
MAFDAFLKIDKITDALPNGELHLESFSWGASNSGSANFGSGAGGGRGRVSFQDFSFTALAGGQSTKLFEAVGDGGRIHSATLRITQTNTDRAAQLTVRFDEVFISNYKFDEGALPAVQRDAPLESVSFNFVKVEFMLNGTTAVEP